jgi:hypothetical protein
MEDVINRESFNKDVTVISAEGYGDLPWSDTKLSFASPSEKHRCFSAGVQPKKDQPEPAWKIKSPYDKMKWADGQRAFLIRPFAASGLASLGDTPSKKDKEK